MMHGTEIRNAAKYFDVLLELPDAGWPYNFYVLHEISNRHSTDESASTATVAVDPFKDHLHSILEEKDVKRYEL